MRWNSFIRADEFCASVRDGTHDSPKPVLNGGKPLVTSKHIKEGNLDLKNSYNISEDHFEKINKRSLVEKWDVLISMIGTLGEVFLVEHEPDYAIKNIGLFKTKSENDGRWLYYYLKSPQAKNFIDTNTQGSTQQYLSLKTLRSFPVLVPTSETEKIAVCAILSLVDRKIELNNKINQNLEEIAKAIFKSWFVDFDPVRAKAEGRPTNLPPEISDLFPDELVVSEIGEIPRGWEIVKISDLTDCVGGATPSTKNAEFWEGGTITWATPKDLSNSKSVHLLETNRKITDKGLQKISSGLLPIGTVLLSSRAPVGYLAITVKPTAINQGFIAMKPKGNYSNFYIFNWCYENLEEIKNRASGTTFSEISKQSFRPIPALKPHGKVMEHFHNFVSPIYEKLLVNDLESRTLISLRDALLPKLISGQLRIPDAEKFLEEAGV